MITRHLRQSFTKHLYWAFDSQPQLLVTVSRGLAICGKSLTQDQLVVKPSLVECQDCRRLARQLILRKRAEAEKLEEDLQRKEAAARPKPKLSTETNAARKRI